MAQAMAAVLASPRFLFREEAIEPGSTDRYPLIDEYALARGCRTSSGRRCPTTSCSAWPRNTSSEKNLPAQVDRMLADPRSAEFFRHFVGQWLQARDIETVLINASAVISRDETPRPRSGSPAGAVPGAEPQAARKS